MTKTASQSFDDIIAWHNQTAKDAACLCGSKASFPVKKNGRYGLDINVVMCRDCGHVYQQRQLFGDDLITFYDGPYRELYGPGDVLKSDKAREIRFANSRNNMLPVFKKFVHADTPLVIEWGTGAGWNLVPIKEAGAKVKGFDPDSVYVAYGSKEFGIDLNVLSDPSALSENLTQKVDMLIVNHVLEHMTDPEEAILQFRNLLSDDGIIYVGLPFIEALDIWGWDHFFHIAHIHYFTIPYFCTLSERAGYAVKEVNREKFYLVLSPSDTKASAAPNTRGLAAQLLLKSWFLYRVVFRAGDAIKHITKAVPPLDRALRKFKQQLRGK